MSKRRRSNQAQTQTQTTTNETDTSPPIVAVAVVLGEHRPGLGRMTETWEMELPESVARRYTTRQHPPDGRQACMARAIEALGRRFK